MGGGTFRGSDVATMVEVERFGAAAVVSAHVGNRSVGEGSVAHLVHKRTVENIAEKNGW